MDTLEADVVKHELLETERYFGKIVKNRPAVDPREEPSDGIGSRYRQHCSCGWSGSWSRSMAAAINGGKAHLRAEARR